MLPERYPIPPEATRCSFSPGLPEEGVCIEVGPLTGSRDVPAVAGVHRIGVVGPSGPRQKIGPSHSTGTRGPAVADRVDRPVLPPCSAQLLLDGVGSDAETAELDAVAGRTVAPPLGFPATPRSATERAVAGDRRVAQIAPVGRVEPDLVRQVVVL